MYLSLKQDVCEQNNTKSMRALGLRIYIVHHVPKASSVYMPTHHNKSTHSFPEYDHLNNLWSPAVKPIR